MPTKQFTTVSTRWRQRFTQQYITFSGYFLNTSLSTCKIIQICSLYFDSLACQNGLKKLLKYLIFHLSLLYCFRGLFTSLISWFTQLVPPFLTFWFPVYVSNRNLTLPLHLWQILLWQFGSALMINCSGLVQHLSVYRSSVWQWQIFIGLPGGTISATLRG